MPAEISSTFEIIVDESIAPGASVTVRNPGRPFRVVSVLVSGQNGATCTVYKNPATGPDVQIAYAELDVALNPGLEDIAAQMQNGIAAQRFTATDDINIAAGVAGLVRVVFVCVGNPAQALTVV